MRAIRIHAFGGPEVLRLEAVPDPIPGPGQAVVELRAIGVNPVDTYIRSGTYGPRDFPFTPGFDGAGVVSAIGPDPDAGQAPRPRVGDRVFLSRSIGGTYAEKTLCAWAQLHRLPDRVSFEQGACVYVAYATAWRAIHQKAHALPGEWVLVHGASGSVGTAAVQVARAGGMRVIGTAGTPEGRDLVAQQGAHHAVDHRRHGYEQEIVGVCAGRGPDVILEMLANENLERDLGMVAPDGRIVVIGNRGRIEIEPRMAMSKESSIIGMSLLNTPPAEHAQVIAAVIAGLESGTLDPIVGTTLPLAEAPRAHDEVITHAAGSRGKIVLLP